MVGSLWVDFNPASATVVTPRRSYPGCCSGGFIFFNLNKIVVVLNRSCHLYFTKWTTGFPKKCKWLLAPSAGSALAPSPLSSPKASLVRSRYVDFLPLATASSILTRGRQHTSSSFPRRQQQPAGLFISSW